MRALSRPRGVLPALLAAAVTVACGSDSDAGASADAGASGGAGASGRASAAAGSSGRPAGASGKGGSGAAGKGGSAGQRELTIRFRGKVLERPLSCSEQYAGVGSKQTRVQPVDFRFYVQDLALIDADGKRVPVKLKDQAPWQTPDVALVDLTDASGSCVGTPETNDVILGSVPAGEYKGISFRNGVPEQLNHEDPVLHPPPLQVTDLAWSWLTGFRFLVAELHQSEPAAADSGDGGAPAGVGLLHIGSTACKPKMGCAHANRNLVELEAFDPEQEVIVADLGALFADTDLGQDAQCHSSAELCAPMFARAGIDYETGDSLPRQRAFRVEPK